MPCPGCETELIWSRKYAKRVLILLGCLLLVLVTGILLKAFFGIDWIGPIIIVPMIVFIFMLQLSTDKMHITVQTESNQDNQVFSGNIEYASAGFFERHPLLLSIMIMIAAGSFVFLLEAGARFGLRWHQFYRHPRTMERIAVVPEELDLYNIQVSDGIRIDIGYANFVIPSQELVSLNSVGTGHVLRGKTDNLRFFVLNPFNPSDTEGWFEALNKVLSQLPDDHPYLKKLYTPQTTALDFEILIDSIAPETFREILFQNREAFRINTTFLTIKAIAGGLGSRGIYTFKTSELRGLLRAGTNPDDQSKAEMHIENIAGTIGLNVYITVIDEQLNAVDMVTSMLSDFRYTIDELKSKDDILTLITEAGILHANDTDKNLIEDRNDAKRLFENNIYPG